MGELCEPELLVTLNGECRSQKASFSSARLTRR